MIYKLCINYTFDLRNVEENYTEVLANLFRGIETYNPSMSVLTWLHICTKRCVFKLEKKRWMHDNNMSYDISAESGTDLMESENNGIDAMPDNWEEMYDDTITEALASLPTIYRDAFLLQLAGYSLKEITEIEFKKGTIPYRNIETIKRRTFNARKILRNKLTRDGESRILDQENTEDLYGTDEADD